MTQADVVLVLVTGLQGTGKSATADRVAGALAAPVLAWDWMMGALTPFEPVQSALGALDRATYRAVGWALMMQAARAQLQRGLSVVLDGMARDHEIAALRELARACGARSLVVLTTCDDPVVVRARIEGRDRAIPGWHELTWEQVERSRRGWTRPQDVDVELDSLLPVDDLLALVTARLDCERESTGRPDGSVVHAVAMPEPGPHLVAAVLEVSDLDRSVALYRDAFGLDLHVSDHGGDDRWTSGRHGAISWTDGAFLHFALYEAHDGAPTTSAQIGFEVTDLGDAHRRAIAAGVEVVHEPKAQPWGTSARYRDPDGNVIELTERTPR